MDNSTISYSAIFDIWIDSNKDIDVVVGVISTNFNEMSDLIIKKFRDFLIKYFIPKLKSKWNKSGRIKSKFLADNEEWLAQLYTICEETLDDEQPSTSHSVKRGRPVKAFEESQERSKRSKISQFCESFPKDLIVSAAKKYEKSEQFKSFTPEKALSLIIDASLSRHQYDVLRSSAKEIGCDIYPHYSKILEVKKKCYPANIKVDESFSSVGLQELLDHTVSRIFQTKTKSEIDEIPNELNLISKWGCDGSSGHSEYHQRFTDENVSDKNMFLTSLVPLKLTDLYNDFYFWKNSEPSSTRLCRPMKFEFVKETADVINNEVNRVNTEIQNLKTTEFEMFNKKFAISHSLTMTMIDGKVATTVSKNCSMAVCFICGAKPTQMNNLDAVILRTNSAEALKFGISPLHARIKFMECILHISYNKSFKAWRTNKDTKEQQEAVKTEIKKKFKLVLGLKVDVVKQGMGTTNDGNVSRRFFENPEITADITGVNVDLIHRFKIILNTINSSQNIDVGKFHTYCMDTAKLYVQLYDWYYMPITVHKVLIHGSKMVSEAILPIGLFAIFIFESIFLNFI